LQYWINAMKTGKHIVSSFDNDLSVLERDLLEMGGLAEARLREKYRQAHDHHVSAPHRDSPSDIGTLGALAQRTVNEVMDSFATRDEHKADMVWQHDRELDDLVARVMCSITTRMS